MTITPSETESRHANRTSAKIFCVVSSLFILALLILGLSGSHHGPTSDHGDSPVVEEVIEETARGDIPQPGELYEQTAKIDSETTELTEESNKLPDLWGLGIIPFVLLLGCIAVLPLIPITEHWWHSNLSRYLVAMALALGTLAFYWIVVGYHSIGHVLNHALLEEYVPFIILLFSLYVISGGIHLSGDVPASPKVNTSFLAIGFLIASFIGTTGASMLLIRPLLKTNRERKYKVHTVVMFIFLVSNIGGTLLPIGDPPLFLGYLQGVPFFWTFNLWFEWIVAGVILLVVYYIWDTFQFKREAEVVRIFSRANVQPLRIQGGINFLWLLGVIACVAFINPANPLPFFEWAPFEFMRELCMILLVGISLVLTSRRIREANQFDYHAIIEVAAIFIGIFITMQVPLEVLKASGEQITTVINEPWQYFWITGGLSSVLDNAPTYLVFFKLAETGTAPPGTMMLMLLGGSSVPVDLLVAISLGAVFMGAMTYIGNGPNFMVKAIAEQAGVEMPSFFGFVFRYSIPVLVPVFVLITVIFLL
ncbi:MAG: sodium:proton antiporter [Phycisphaerae bacterium]|nr:sodium:proton antiporter [Phycisphaerae bacterium]|tara:strand:- start:710 stop:2317 length:1608 start_codon:yes stop_codon:yes gene_type:complete